MTKKVNLTFETFQIFDNLIWKRFQILLRMNLLFILLFTVSCQFESAADSTELDYPFETTKVELPNDSVITYTDSGNGDETLLLIHGLGSYIPAWKMNIDALANNYRVVALDLPGFGKSSKSASNHSIPFYSETVIQLLNELGIDAVTLVGHSMGGQIALYTSYHAPQRVKRLILSAPAGFEEFTPQDRTIFESFISPESIAETPEMMIRQNFRANFYNYPEEAEFMIEDRLSMMDLPDFQNYARAQAESIFAMLDEPVKDLIPKIEIPTLVIFGANDALIPNRNLHPNLTVQNVAESGTDKMPNATLIMIEDAGHFVHFEQPDEFNQAVIEFLEQ